MKEQSPRQGAGKCQGFSKKAAQVIQGGLFVFWGKLSESTKGSFLGLPELVFTTTQPMELHYFFNKQSFATSMDLHFGHISPKFIILLNL
jgi:hypothetical protein